ncbi:CDF family Co(II)/Ni(II) efflux transporter DmeF [Aquincola sp. S2]|uniref:CDF family Co(II)/Ni(II) efflux transporter DmeF n=1 Tax=Pseudaquabacterium terrae TaxID=2732868 RepID=A0ABX2EKL4_9BURK|nr:CDF family Co(II)/Ni(II) efflux transporter DmeF [Aquabacterium terrae]NRF69143.1 CDF family Co(II)/Ni(II) efflux transporter DmeF [Aquabacterium terrae]
MAPHPRAQTSSHTSTHQHDLRPFRHSHAFGDDEAGQQARGRALAGVALLTVVTMVVELAAGWWSGSLALLADGWHMGTHAAALGGAWFALHWARRVRDDERYAFGGWKIEVLAGYTSALLLAAVALGLAVDAVRTLIQPRPVAYAEAMAVAVLGLVVNLASVWLLARGQGRGGHHHDHAHAHVHAHHNHQGHGHAHGHQHHDSNFRAAYLHVLADALTSVLAIAALAGGLWFGWGWLDPAVALVAAVVIGQWSFGLLRDSATALVDSSAKPMLRDAVRTAIEADGDAKLADLHVWQVGPQAWSVVASVVADDPKPALAYRERLQGIGGLRHITVEVHRCPGQSC